MNLLKLIASDNFITVNKEVIKKVGLEEAIILGELISELDYWTKNDGLTSDGYFFSTIENIEEKTTLSGHKQRNALTHLKELGLVDYASRGCPAKRYIKIFEDAILAILSEEKQPEAKKVSTRRKREVPEELKPEEKKATEDKPKKVSRKDQLVNYVNELDFSDNTKESLFKWIFNIGLPKGITLEQLRDKLSTLDTNCNGNESLMQQAIENAYLNNYFGFFVPNKPAKQHATSRNDTYRESIEQQYTNIRTNRQVALADEVF